MVRLLHVDLRLPMLSYTVRSPGADSALCGGPIFHLSCREHLHHHESVLLLRFHSSGCRVHFDAVVVFCMGCVLLRSNQ